jgi:MYXO-CTERM domain-containing protein
VKRFFFASIAAAALLAGSEARANGRFPESNQLYFSKQDPNLVLLRVTFGLLVSHDRGKTWDWVCEQSIGATGAEDPMYATTPSGRIVAATFEGIAATDDQACNWSLAGGDLQGGIFIDLAKNPNDEKNIVAFQSAYHLRTDAGVILYSSQLYETTDEGKTWAKLGDPLDPSLLGYTVDLTATDANRIYVSAVRDPGPTQVAVFLTSIDHGKSWTEQTIELTGTERAIYIAGVDPNDPDKVYIRTQNNPDAPGRLILREKNTAADAGTAPGTFRTIFTGNAPLEAFALSPDGTKVWVGSPLDGVNLASTTDYKFTHQSDSAVKCLSLASDGLWACSNEKVGFITGLSADEGKTFNPLLHFCTIRGPLACADTSSTTTQCAPVWAAQRSTLGCDPDTSSGGDGGASSGDGGATSSSTSGGSSGGSSKSSCNCEAVLPNSGWSSIVGALAAVGLCAAAATRRRRRR